jgi:hypothetical protein
VPGPQWAVALGRPSLHRELACLASWRVGTRDVRDRLDGPSQADEHAVPSPPAESPAIARQTPGLSHRNRRFQKAFGGSSRSKNEHGGGPKGTRLHATRGSRATPNFLLVTLRFGGPGVSIRERLASRDEERSAEMGVRSERPRAGSSQRAEVPAWRSLRRRVVREGGGPWAGGAPQTATRVSPARRAATLSSSGRDDPARP